MKTICPECYSENDHITPLLKPRDCLQQHTQYICGSCGRCICIEHDQNRGLQRWNFPFTTLDAAKLYVRIAEYTLKKGCAIYEISNAKERVSYKIFGDEEALLLYLEKHKDRRCVTKKPAWGIANYREFEKTQIRKLTATEIDTYLAKRI